MVKWSLRKRLMVSDDTTHFPTPIYHRINGTQYHSMQLPHCRVRCKGKTPILAIAVLITAATSATLILMAHLAQARVSHAHQGSKISIIRRNLTILFAMALFRHHSTTQFLNHQRLSNNWLKQRKNQQTKKYSTFTHSFTIFILFAWY